MAPYALGQGLGQLAAGAVVGQHPVAARSLDRGGQRPRAGDLDLERRRVALRLLLDLVEVLGRAALRARRWSTPCRVGQPPPGGLQVERRGRWRAATARPVMRRAGAAAGQLGEVRQAGRRAARRARPGPPRRTPRASSPGCDPMPVARVIGAPPRPGGSTRSWPSRRRGCRRRRRPPARARCRTPGRAARSSTRSPSTATTARCSSPWARSCTVPVAASSRVGTVPHQRGRMPSIRSTASASRGPDGHGAARPARCRARTAACRRAPGGRAAGPCAGRS